MFDTSSEIKFGRNKGQTWDSLVGSEKGQGYLRWLIDQPVQEGKYKQGNIERNEALKNLLLGYPQEKKDVPEDRLADHEQRITKLEGFAIKQAGLEW